MNNKNVLSKPIVIVEHPSVVGIYEYSPYSERRKLHPNIMVVSEEDINAIRLASEYDLPRNINCRSILVRHPYTPNKYVLIEELEETLHSDLQKCLFEIAQHLGATRAEWYKEVVDEGVRKKDYNGNITISRVSSSIDGSYNSTKMQSEQKHESYKQEWTQCGISTPDKRRRGYQKAFEIAKEYRLDDNQGIRNLLNGRNPEYDNICTSLEVNISITNDINKSYDYAFSLNAMDEIFKIDAHITSTIEKHRKVELRYKIFFEECEQPYDTPGNN